MAIKVIMFRVVDPGHEEGLNELLLELRARALKRSGYVSGHTLVLASDQSMHLVISEWTTLKAWRDWENHPDRLEVLDKINAILRLPARTEVWLDRGVEEPSAV